MLAKPVPSSLPSMTGNALRRLRVNIGGTASEWANDSDEVINVEEARSDIRSTTRAGYTGYNSLPGLQALLDTVGTKKTLLFPANGVFNLGGGMLRTKAQQQYLFSNGMSEIANGGAGLDYNFCRMEGFRITGATAYGVDVKGAVCNASKLEISDKTVAAVNLTTYTGWYYALENSRIWNNPGKGVYGHMNDAAADWGDLWLNNVQVYGAGIGMEFGRIGGVNLTGCKIQGCTAGGLLFSQPADTIHYCWGHYINGSSFEDNANYDFKTDSAVTGAWIPRRIEVVGGTIHKTFITKGRDIVFTNVLMPTITVDSTTGMVVFDNCPPFDPPATIGGTGKWVAYGIDSSDNPWMRTSRTFKITDQYGTATLGPYITSIASAPNYIGQRALVASEWYTAAGTSAPADWVKDSGAGGGGGLDGGLFTDTYTITGMDGGAFV